MHRGRARSCSLQKDTAIRGLVAVLLAACAGYAAGFLAAALVPHPGKADAAIVFGNEVLADGRPSARLAARVDAAARVWREGRAALVVVSGGRGASGFQEAAVMRDRLLAAGLPAGAVVEDDDGATTAATARNAARILRERGLASALVVTQWFHVPRCLMALRREGVSAEAAAYPAFVEPRDAYSAVRELVAIPRRVLGR